MYVHTIINIIRRYNKYRIFYKIERGKRKEVIGFDGGMAVLMAG